MEALFQREEKTQRLKRLESEFPDKAIVSIRLNIPGPEKKADWIERLFKATMSQLIGLLYEHEIPYQICESEFAKNYYENMCILVCDIEPSKLKRFTVDFEDHKAFGRFVDIDVLGTSREQLGFGERKCYLCDTPAFICSRSRKHSVSELIQFMILKTQGL